MATRKGRAAPRRRAPGKGWKITDLLALHSGPVPVLFILNLLVLLAAGGVMLYSASYTTGILKFGDALHYMKSYRWYLVIGGAAMAAGAVFNYHFLRNATMNVLIYLFTLACLVLVYFCEPINECHRWLHYGNIPVTIQASEIAKLAMVLVAAFFMDRYAAMVQARSPLPEAKTKLKGREKARAKALCKKYRKQDWVDGIVRIAAPLLLVEILVLPERHISGGILIALIVASMMLLGGAGGKRLRWLTAGGIVFLSIAVPLGLPYLMELSPTIADRVGDFLNKDGTLQHQTLQSLYAIGSGGLFGRGLGNSVEKQLYLPECTNDYIFSVICEELGLFGAVVIILLFITFLVQCFHIALNASDRYGSYIAFGLTAQIAWQLVLNVAVVTNSVPATGVGLPFFSSGGSSLIILMGQMGLMISISRFGTQAELNRKKKQAGGPQQAAVGSKTVREQVQ